MEDTSAIFTFIVIYILCMIVGTVLSLKPDKNQKKNQPTKAEIESSDDLSVLSDRLEYEIRDFINHNTKLDNDINKLEELLKEYQNNIKQTGSNIDCDFKEDLNKNIANTKSLLEERKKLLKDNYHEINFLKTKKEELVCKERLLKNNEQLKKLKEQLVESSNIEINNNVTHAVTDRINEINFILSKG